MTWVTLRDGQRLHVRIVGRGKPVVLVHGFASDSGSWLPFVAPLAHRYRFIIPDLRGFGASRSVPLRLDCPLTTYAHDLSDVASELSLQDAPLVGISMGALSSVQCFKLQLAGRFGRYMHIDQGLVISNDDTHEHGLLGPEQASFFAGIRTLLTAVEAGQHVSYRQLPKPLHAQMAKVFAQFAGAAFTHPRVQQGVSLLTSQPRLLPYFLPDEGFRTYMRIMRAYLDSRYDLRDAFAALTVPTTVLIGGTSRMYPPEGQRGAATLLPSARIRELSGVGHMLPFEAPRRFLQELRTFLDA